MSLIRSAGVMAIITICACGCKKGEEPLPRDSSPTATAPAASAPSPAAPAAPAATSEEAAIKTAIEQHLRENSGINMAAMDTSVDSISVQGDQAQANVTFRLKQGGTTMQMNYFLSRHANGWLVMRSQPGGGQFAHPPMDKTHSGMADNAQPAGTPDLHRFFKHDSSSNAADSPASSSPKN